MVTVNGEIVVREGMSEALPPTLISVSDPDTPTEKLVFVLDTPPTFGYLQSNYSTKSLRDFSSSADKNFQF
jgi:Cadherin-like